MSNHSFVTYFIIMGISDVPRIQVLIFLLVLLIYLLSLGGNMTILLLVCLDHQLHTPMYFFLGNLSIMDMCSTTITLYKVLTTFLSGDNTISLVGCLTQCYIFTSLIAGELLLLTAMSYDRYVAICNPLNYYIVMSHRVCTWLAGSCWILGFIEIIPHIVILSGITCFRSKEINHFFCDIVPLTKLSCSNTNLLNLTVFLSSTFHATFSLLLTFIPYVFIIVTILKIRSSTGRRKAFYTCSSHLTVILLLYATLICQYRNPTSVESLESNKLLSLFNAAAVPVLNPVIYSLKNEAVKSVLKRRLRRLRENT